LVSLQLSPAEEGWRLNKRDLSVTKFVTSRKEYQKDSSPLGVSSNHGMKKERKGARVKYEISTKWVSLAILIFGFLAVYH
jgi:hypothetical protein